MGQHCLFGSPFEDLHMNRVALPPNPLLLGFEELDRLIERTTKAAGEGYPPYNIERVTRGDGAGVDLRITLAVAGFTRGQLDVQLENNELTIRGRQSDETPRDFIYRGIAARQFCRTFILADGLEVTSADLNNGLLEVNLVRLEPSRRVKTIAIGAKKVTA
jgi:HSP20 family molecular chaperone IbpA